MLLGIVLSAVGITWGDLAPKEPPAVTWAMLAPVVADEPLTYATAYEAALRDGSPVTVCVGQPQRIIDQEREEARKCGRLFVAATEVEMLPRGVHVMVPGNNALWIVEQRHIDLVRSRYGVEVMECGPDGCRRVGLPTWSVP